MRTAVIFVSCVFLVCTACGQQQASDVQAAVDSLLEAGASLGDVYAIQGGFAQEEWFPVVINRLQESSAFSSGDPRALAIRLLCLTEDDDGFFSYSDEDQVSLLLEGINIERFGVSSAVLGSIHRADASFRPQIIAAIEPLLSQNDSYSQLSLAVIALGRIGNASVDGVLKLDELTVDPQTPNPRLFDDLLATGMESEIPRLRLELRISAALSKTKVVGLAAQVEALELAAPELQMIGTQAIVRYAHEQNGLLCADAAVANDSIQLVEATFSLAEDADKIECMDVFGLASIVIQEDNPLSARVRARDLLTAMSELQTDECIATAASVVAGIDLDQQQ